MAICCSFTQHTCSILLSALFISAVSASLSDPYDNENIVGDPTIILLDVPNHVHRRQISGATGAKLTTPPTNTTIIDSTATPTSSSGIDATPSSGVDATPPPGINTNGTGAVTHSNAVAPSNTATQSDTPTTVKVIQATVKTTTTGEAQPTYPLDNETVHWADHNETFEDDHDYYRVKYIPPGADGHTYWVDLDSWASNSPGIMKASLRLTSRRAKQVSLLGFPFEFYGHDITQLLITTGGFLYVGTYIHRFLAATQYIAPLMANFDPAVSNDVAITYAHNGSQFTAEWRNISLADNARDDSPESAGPFSFQTTLFNDGRIVFAYKQIPIDVDNINSASHPVRIGVADAYYNDTYINPLLKKRSIFEYHRVPVNFTKIVSNSAVLLTPNPTCHDQLACHECVTCDIGFNCSWCPSQGRCSSGFDRWRQDWVRAGCHISNITEEADCNRVQVDVKSTKAPPPPPPLTKGPPNSRGHPDEDEDIEYDPNINPDANSQPMKNSGSGLHLGGIIFIIIIIIVISVLLVWVVYAYRKPTSDSGIFLIGLRNKIRRPGSAESNIKYKYHKPDNDDLQPMRV